MTFPARLYVLLGETPFIFLSYLWSQGGAVKAFVLSLKMAKEETVDVSRFKLPTDLKIERQKRNGIVLVMINK